MRPLGGVMHFAGLLAVAGAIMPAVAQETPNDAVCAVCPDPARDIGPDNLPPKQATAAYMWVNAAEGLKLVRNPEWSGDVPELACPRCPNPFAPLSWSNLPLSGDDQQFRFLREVRANGVRTLVVERNPDWKGEQPGSDAEEPDDEEPAEDDNPITEPLDRGRSAYHVTGQDVFQRKLLDSIGGVLSQSAVDPGQTERFPTLELVLGSEGEYPGYITVSESSVSGRYRIRYEDLVPAVLFVESGGTSLFTLWDTDKLPENFAEDAGFVETAQGRGHVAIEFADTRYEGALTFLDLCSVCVADTQDRRTTRFAQRLEAGESATTARSSSYINTDIGATYRLLERGAGRIAVAGSVFRFYWSAVSDEVQPVSVDASMPITRPEDMRSSAKQLLDMLSSNSAWEDRHIMLLMLGVDVLQPLRLQASLRARRMLADSLYLFETLALLRGAKRNAPDQWSAFVAALSSDWFLARYPEPWERYTRTRCRVFPSDAGCG